MMYEEEPGRALMHLVQDALPLAAAAGDVAPLDRVVEELKRRETVNGRKKVE
jgi:hypothetical protein